GAFPRSESLISQKPEIIEKLTRSLLKKRVWSAAQAVADNLGKTATPQERKELFSTFLDHLDYHDQSWHHQAQIDSMIDLASGIHTKKISEAIQKANRRDFNESHQGEETYSFAGPELLLTPYSEILNLFRGAGLKSGDSVVDLGAGFGRVGLALATKYPGVSVTGYEIVKDRIEEGARVAHEWGLSHRVQLLEQNLADPQFEPKAADIYYAFNPVSGPTFDKILDDLRRVGLKSGKKFRFIVFGPSPFYKTDAQPWLKELKGPGIPEGDELKIYEFDPAQATKTIIVDPGTFTNPYALKPSQEVSQYPKTQLMEVSQARTIQDHLAAHPESSPNKASFLSPNYLAAWASGWPMEISKDGNQLIISSKKTDVPGKENFVEPLGGTPAEKAALIKKIIRDKKRKGIQAEFSFVSEDVYKLLQSSEEIATAEAPDYFDFIYPLENLAELEKSKKLRDRANQATAFETAHPDTKVEILSRLNSDDATTFRKRAHGFLDRWLSGRRQAEGLSEYERSTLETETRAAKHLVDSLVRPQQVQLVVRRDGETDESKKVIAYASGEIRTDSEGERTLILYVQKSDGTKNSIPFINRQLAQEVFNHPEIYGSVDFVNLM
ncbi:MAG: class I SAM-dependent methyltransferase, partial [Proteobacteria bacterium]|nr:class I SAM-dependent methyltransferase [Pseudomonadota bacterium]